MFMNSQRLRIAVIAASVTSASLALAEAPQNARALVCQAGPGAVTEWKGQNPITSPSNNEITFTFSELNQTAGTARLSGPGGSSIVGMLVTAAGVTFVEKLSSGGIVVTTVYASTERTARTYLMADTRHNSILGSPIVSQFFGICRGQF